MSPEELARIHAEEEARFLAKKELERRHRSWWEMANSGFGLWFLSTVVLGSIAFAFNTAHQRLLERDAARRRAADLDSELRYRLQRLSERMGYFREVLDEHRAEAKKPKGWYGFLRQLCREANQPSEPYLPDYRPLGVHLLFDKLAQARKDAGQADPNEFGRIERARRAWEEDYKVAVLDYDRFDPAKTTDGAYYALMAEHGDRIKKSLDEGDISHWVAAPKGDN